MPLVVSRSGRGARVLAREPLAPNISRRARGARANGQVAVGVVFFGYPDQPETLQVLQLLTLDTNGRIAQLTAFVGTELEPFELASRSSR